MPNVLPLLPLRDIVVFPRMVITLFMGRAKSIKAVETASAQEPVAIVVAISQRAELIAFVGGREREIGDQLRIAQVWQTVRDTPNVRLVRSILLEGWFDQAGVPKVVPLEEDDAFPYATVKSGHHLIQVE